MNEKKFDVLSISISIAALLFSFFTFFTVESIAVAVISLVLSYRRREKYRTKIAVVISILAIVLALVFFAILCHISILSGKPAINYWLINLIF